MYTFGVPGAYLNSPMYMRTLQVRRGLFSTHVYMCTCVHVYMRTCVHAYMRVLFVYVRTYTRTFRAYMRTLQVRRLRRDLFKSGFGVDGDDNKDG
jgi:hypothetical protein